MTSRSRNTVEQSFSYLDDDSSGTIKKAGYLDYHPFGDGDFSKEPSERDRQRYNEIRNYLNIRMEYYRDVKPKGIWSVLHNPLPYAGIGVAFGALMMSLRRKDDKAKMRMLGWRWHASIFTVVSLAAGVYIDQVREDRWVRREATRQDLPINENDIGRPMIELRPIYDKVKRYDELQKSRDGTLKTDF